ncbi:putative mitochondrial inner membrane protease subunit 1 isoform X2 [Iris pallida]|uniref:Mitochondrial inner membrane protease subunit 1 isoform X2 n=1 Tax=Iris pallida TaxID=29817 RepID=A0AAX6F867_IRIPA|nr:putative mitochondrial inner membrane protease subunit 1 isoform X2 [Iris pallida]KAJ6826544.1 putative mitochondrial inner membrane protease subunit 1 isoform X2 [Iris pallida]
MAAGRFAAWAARLNKIPFRDISAEAADRFLLVAKTICAVHVFNAHVASVALLRGPSMLPAVSITGDVVAVDRIAARRGSVGVGDIVLVTAPDNPRKVIAKRVTGLGGDAVTFLVDPQGEESETVVVPKGHVWIQGDNIYDSRDSRQFGPVPYGLIQGRVFFRLWPLGRFGFIEQPTSL